MDLILWRHAEAEESEPDLERELTAKGRKQAAKMAVWLNRHLPEHCRILVSPAARTIQTAEALNRTFTIDRSLAPGVASAQLLQAADWPNDQEPVMIIGHQPVLGQTAALLISGTAQYWSIRKANVWWITRRSDSLPDSNYLRAVVAPELID